MGSRRTAKANVARVWQPEAKEILRRRVVALLVRGLSQAEIVQQLSTPAIPDIAGGMRQNPSYFENPKTGRPYDQSTICRLIQAIFADWRATDVERVALWRGEIIAHNRELERAAWASGDLEMVLATLQQRAKLIGAFAPVQFEDVTDSVAKRDLDELRKLLGGPNPSPAAGGLGEGET